MFREKQGNLGNVLRVTLCATLACLFCVATGCTRRFFRKQTDKEVEQILKSKDKYDFWKIENYHIYPDPRARFADTSNPDRPPMPPDDPAARDLSPNPQGPGRKGVKWEEGYGYLEMIKGWDALNRSTLAEEPLPLPAPLPESKLKQVAHRQADQDTLQLPTLAFQDPGAVEVPPSDGYLITLDQSVELGVINSREFQAQREALYLAALPVSLQRFSFAAQFFATEAALREWNRSQAANPGNRWNFASTGGFTKLFSTGALLTLQFANQTIINLTGNAARRTTSVSAFNLDLVQPLLQGGGRAVTLEPLTQVERSLVYQIRNYARFRKIFYASIAADPAAGYLQTLFRQVSVDIQRKNLEALNRFLPYFQGFQEMGTIRPTQVDQVRLNKLNAEIAVLTAIQVHKDSLDRFKLQLGVPVNLPLKFDDGPLRPITAQLKRYEKIQQDFDQMSKELDKDEFFLQSNAKQLRMRLKELVARAPLIQGTERLRETFPQRWAEREKLNREELLQRIKTDEEEYRKLKEKKLELLKLDKDLPRPEEERMEQLTSSLQLSDFEQQLRAYMEEPWIKEAQMKKKDKQEIDIETRRIHAERYEDLTNAFNQLLGEAVNERYRMTGASWPRMAPVEVEGLNLLDIDEEVANTVASHVALTNRLDLMNQRALVVDAWRQLKVSANSLLGVVDVGYHLDVTTLAGEAKPLAFAPQRTRQNVFLNVSLPLVRLTERNAYRTALIVYQQTRRDLMAAEDQIVATIRRTIRQLRVIAQTYAIRQYEAELSYRQVESSFEEFRAPPEVGGQGGSGNAFSLTQQLLQAQQGLLRNQTALYNLWIDYQTNRLNLYRDLELMLLDGRGVWIDELSNREPGPPGNLPVSRLDSAERNGRTQRGSERSDTVSLPIPPPVEQR